MQARVSSSALFARLKARDDLALIIEKDLPSSLAALGGHADMIQKATMTNVGIQGKVSVVPEKVAPLINAGIEASRQDDFVIGKMAIQKEKCGALLHGEQPIKQLPQRSARGSTGD
eukprot:TRINITY_DN21050_c0_g3_i1.p2 TRINITY_DN21050_c0_g3~~TRINITY_DN21050_c0_g3_i1.p2  ORF type:complete len:135 (-),score=11.61 TRINITY_DN21050_c0_g3_i1:135-482(-)